MPDRTRPAHGTYIVCVNTFSIKNKEIKLSTNAITGEATQPDPTRSTKLHYLPIPPFTTPLPTIAPMTACVLETGTAGSGGRLSEIRKCSNVSDEKRIKTSDCDKMTIHATIGEKGKTF